MEFAHTYILINVFIGLIDVSFLINKCLNQRLQFKLEDESNLQD